MKLVLAAPDSFLPSALTALVAQLSTLHFFTNEVLAAPASALPSLPTALVSQVSCANAVPTVPMAKVATTAASKIRFIGFLPLELVPGLDPGIPRRSSRGRGRRRALFNGRCRPRAAPAICAASALAGRPPGMEPASTIRRDFAH